MPVASFRDILDPAFQERYGVAAFNVVDGVSLQAVIDAATELDSPLIVQTSVKTVKSIGAKPLYAMFRSMADEAPVPITLHLDHCPEREWATTCLETGWNSVLFDGSHLDIDENTRQTAEVVEEARGYGADVEGEIESVKGVEDDVGSDEASEVHPVDVSVKFIEDTGVYAFAPAIGTAHGLYAGRPNLDPGAGDRDGRAASDPHGAPRRHGPRPGAVPGPHRPWLRQGEHLDGPQDRVRRLPSGVPRGQPRQARPARPAAARERGRQGDGHRAHAHLRLGRQGQHRTDRLMPAIFFDCDGVLADTERYGHLPAFNETFEQEGLPVRWSDADYAEKLLIGGGKERMASLLTDEFVRDNGLPSDPDGQRELLARWHAVKTAAFKARVEAGDMPARPGIARIVDEALAAGWTLAVASTSAEKSVRGVLEHAVGKGKAGRFTVLAGDVVPAKKPDPAVYMLALERTGADPAGRSSSRIPATACALLWGRACAAWSP